MPCPRAGDHIPERQQHPASARRGAQHGPYQQGQLDGLCGIYSIINALALLTADGKPLGLTASSRLFREGIAFVAARTPLEYVCGFGIEPPLWLRLTRHLADLRGREIGITIGVERPFAGHPHVGFRDMLKVVETALDRDAVLLASLGGEHNHYSVIAGHDRCRLLLSDSCGLRWIDKAACGSGRSWRRHQIGSPWVQVMRVEDGRCR